MITGVWKNLLIQVTERACDLIRSCHLTRRDSNEFCASDKTGGGFEIALYNFIDMYINHRATRD